MIKIILLLLAAGLNTNAQDIFNLKPLIGTINTSKPEMAFNQINDTLAFFTAIENLDPPESSIYYSVKNSNKWSKRRYSIFNYDKFSTGEITFIDSDRAVFTLCNDENKCKLILYENNTFSDINAINNKGNKNSQPHITNHNSQKVLYFSSDRSGGFGGLDIWISIIDKSGNFGSPINLGNKINTPFDEITPFYHKKNKKLYFASNQQNGIGGFDVYFSEGKYNLWIESENFLEINSVKDEMYLSIYNDTIGFIASNREGSKFESTEYCCNDIFSFEFNKQKKNPAYKFICNCIPISLYFPNNYPAPSNNINVSYKDIYRSYVLLKKQYLAYNKSLELFFEEDLRIGFIKLNELLSYVLSALDQDKSSTIFVKGYASPLDNKTYNMNLSKRRIQTLVEYINQYKNGILSKYITSGDLKIIERAFGENNSDKQISDNPRDILKSIYSADATYERKIEIVKVLFENN